MATTEDRPLVSATTLGDLLRKQVIAHPHSEALVFPGRRVTYADLDEIVTEMADRLVQLGVGPGDRVGILLPGSVELVAALFAAARISAIGVPVNARFKSTELSQIVTHSGMKVLLTGEQSFDLIESAFPEIADDQTLPIAGAPELETIAFVDGDAEHRGAYVCFDRVPRSDAARRLAAELGQAARVRDCCLLVYTSGTTSAPKGAQLSNEALTRAAAGIAGRLQYSPGDRVWTPIPLFHGGGITFALSAISAGIPFVHPGFFDPGTTLEMLCEERITVALPAFETIWMPVLNRPDFDEFDLGAVRVVMAVGVEERLRVMQAALPRAKYVSCVAMTESAAFLTLSKLTDSDENARNTGGHPMPGMVCRVVDIDTGADLGAGAQGELLFRGPTMFDGYFRDPALTEKSIDSDGWYHSGDIVVTDDDGRVTFVSRLKDMLKVGGENVAAAEVEGYLLTHPAVEIVAVVGAPDAYYVEVPAAYVQVKDGAELTEQELIDFCQGKIATFRIPRYVRFVASRESWPMSGTKIKKVVLREWIADDLAESGITEAPRLMFGR